MRLTVIGCSGSIPGPASAASCYLVQAPFQGRVFSVVLDLGPGAFGSLQNHLDPSQLDAVGLSHLHPDHCLDVCALYVASRYGPDRAATDQPAPRRITIYGPVDTVSRIRRAYEVDGGAEPGPSIAEQFDYRTWASTQQIGPFQVETVRVAHPVEAYAVRVHEDVAAGGTLVFSGDTGPCRALVDLAHEADLLLCEAGFRHREDNPPNLHLSGRQAAETATEAGVGALVLTHIPPWHEPDQILREARPHFPRSVELARPGARWTIG